MESQFNSLNGLQLAQEGFAQFNVPPEEFYVKSYSRRGNADLSGGATPVLTSVRWGNPKYLGGSPGFGINQHNKDYLSGFKQKKGMQGVFESTRWGTPSAVGFGVLAETNNTAISTRGGPLRNGAGKRADYLDRQYTTENLYPGYAKGDFLLTNRHNTGPWEPKRKQLTIVNDRPLDALEQTVLRNNPFYIPGYNFREAMKSVRDDLDGHDVEIPNTGSYNSGFLHGLNEYTGQVLNDWEEHEDKWSESAPDKTV